MHECVFGRGLEEGLEHIRARSGIKFGILGGSGKKIWKWSIMVKEVNVVCYFYIFLPAIEGKRTDQKFEERARDERRNSSQGREKQIRKIGSGMKMRRRRSVWCKWTESTKNEKGWVQGSIWKGKRLRSNEIGEDIKRKDTYREECRMFYRKLGMSGEGWTMFKKG